MSDTLEKLGNSQIQHGPDNNRIYLMKLDPADLPENSRGMTPRAPRQIPDRTAGLGMGQVAPRAFGDPSGNRIYQKLIHPVASLMATILTLFSSSYPTTYPQPMRVLVTYWLKLRRLATIVSKT